MKAQRKLKKIEASPKPTLEMIQWAEFLYDEYLRKSSNSKRINSNNQGGGGKL